ncbi:hypothetical protein SAMN05421678_11827 [Actinopolymorpha cephalotaxi]|uniref:Uncharacterized protein n=1 Tax=Actinopolymorpha cephalotaxi TaxID=504797 RepID=A0A1I3A461_9ACTN|nr:hypothetical protein [Actinopolymorpha cephalotaxi]NYH85361.1 hypothetical protein [Actinopolymorpha cephalotaxi]SFH44680.1 hypothetical protein SAMN05421678_11827 [Actinopolymorpha cephalotaxi]
MAVTRMIIGFGANDKLAFSQQFPEEKLPELRPLFDYGDDELMCGGSYEVTEVNGDRVAAILGIALKPDLEYYLEAWDAG